MHQPAGIPVDTPPPYQSALAKKTLPPIPEQGSARIGGVPEVSPAMMPSWPEQGSARAATSLPVQTAQPRVQQVQSHCCNDVCCTCEECCKCTLNTVGWGSLVLLVVVLLVVVCWLVAFELWLPGAILIGISPPEHQHLSGDNHNQLYVAGFACMMVAVGISGFLLLCVICFGGMATLLEWLS